MSKSFLTKYLLVEKLFLPVSTPLIVWYLFILLFMFGHLALTIIVTCFQNEAARVALYQAIDFLLPVILIVDMWIELNTGFIKKGKIVLERKLALREYRSHAHFYTDVVSFVMSIVQIIIHNAVLDRVTVLNYIVLVKLVKIVYIDSLIKKYILKSYSQILYYEMLKNFIFLVLVCHVIGSFFFYLDVRLYQEGTYSTERLWIFSSYCYENIYYQEFWVQYTYSFYFACVTLSGTAYGDLVPLNPIETAYIFGCLVFPMLLYAYIFSSIYSAISSRRMAANQIRKYKFLAKEYLESLGVNYKMVNKILTYLEFTHKENIVVDSSFIKDLTPTVQKAYIKKSVEDKFDFGCFSHLLKLANLKPEYLKEKMYPLIRQQYFPERFSLLSAKKLKLYYVNTGKVVEVVKIHEHKKLSKPLQKNHCIAKTAFFTNQIPTFKLHYESNSFVVCHSVDYKEFKQLLQSEAPSLNECFCRMQNQMIDEQRYEIMSEKCYFCDQATHIFSKCPHMRPIQQNLFIQRPGYRVKQERKMFNRDKKFSSFFKPEKDSLEYEDLGRRPTIIKRKQTFTMNKGQFFKLKSPKESKKSHKIYVSHKKKVQDSLFNLFTDSQFYNYLAEFDRKSKSATLQTELELFEIKQQLESSQRHQLIEKVCFWDNFYPNYNV